MDDFESEMIGVKRPFEVLQESPSILDHQHHNKSVKTPEFHYNKDRWSLFSKTENYVNVVGQMMLPEAHLGQYGYKPDVGKYPFDKVSALGVLMCPLRKVSVIEKWSPYEIGVFEAAITLFGKNFFRIQKYVKTKTTKEVIEFYYDWKKTEHYDEWKKAYIPDDREIPALVETK